MPRDTSINEIADLATKDLPLLYRFRDRAKIEIGRMLELDPERITMFIVGFQVIPSLFPLHCHLLDWSFSTGNAYHPRHWKVQFSNMFITLDKVIEEVEQTGRMVVDFDAYWHDWKTKPIRCPVCPGPQPQWEGDINALVSRWCPYSQMEIDQDSASQCWIISPVGANISRPPHNAEMCSVHRSG